MKVFSEIIVPQFIVVPNMFSLIYLRHHLIRVMLLNSWTVNILTPVKLCLAAATRNMKSVKSNYL